MLEGGKLGAHPMKILHAISSSDDGAVQRAFEQTVTALARTDHAQRVVIPKDERLAMRLRSVGLEPMELPFRARFDFSSKRRLNNEISAFDADLVLSWTPEVSKDITPAHGGRGQAKHLGVVGKAFASSQYESCDHLLTFSQQRVDRVISAGWPPEKVTKLPPMIVSDGIKPYDRKTFFTPATAKLVVVVGNLTTGQGFQTLMEAIGRISGIYVWIVGEGPDKKKLDDQALEIGIKPRTRFLGAQSDIMPLIAAADIVISPATKDDVGEQVLRAWGCGKAVIAADAIGPGLLVRHRETGVLVPVEDARSLAEAIKWVNQDSDFSSRIAIAGAEEFAKYHSEAVVIPKYEALFQTLVTSRADPAPADQ